MNVTTPDTPRPYRGFLAHTSRAVYGTIVATAVVAAEAAALSEWGCWRFLSTLVVTVLVLWFAEIYAEVLGDSSTDPFRVRVTRAASEHWAVLEVAVPLSIPLILGGLGVLSSENAVLGTLLVAVVSLGTWGGITARQRGGDWPQVLFAVGASALIGVIIILLKSWH